MASAVNWCGQVHRQLIQIKPKEQIEQKPEVKRVKCESDSEDFVDALEEQVKEDSLTGRCVLL